MDANKAIDSSIEQDEIYLYKINTKKAMKMVYYSNIIFYDNTNQTLPVGMNLSDEVLIDLGQYNLEKINEEDFKINYFKDEYTNKIVKVHSVEYNVK